MTSSGIAEKGVQGASPEGAVVRTAVVAGINECSSSQFQEFLEIVLCFLSNEH